MGCSKGYLPGLLTRIVSVITLRRDVVVLIVYTPLFSCVSGTVWSTDNNIPEAVSISKVFRGFDFRRIVPCFGPATDAGREWA